MVSYITSRREPFLNYADVAITAQESLFSEEGEQGEAGHIGNGVASKPANTQTRF